LDGAGAAAGAAAALLPEAAGAGAEDTAGLELAPQEVSMTEIIRTAST
jgi:hypothetical protein